MAKNKTSKPAKLALVPASGISGNSLAVAAAIPAGLVKLTLPPLLKPDTIPIGSMVSGEIIALANSVSGKESMRESKLIHLRHDNGAEFLLPLTGVIKKAIGGNDGVTANIGKKLFVVRQPDGAAANFGGNKMFMFDVYLSDK